MCKISIHFGYVHYSKYFIKSPREIGPKVKEMLIHYDKSKKKLILLIKILLS